MRARRAECPVKVPAAERLRREPNLLPFPSACPRRQKPAECEGTARSAAPLTCCTRKRQSAPAQAAGVGVLCRASREGRVAKCARCVCLCTPTCLARILLEIVHCAQAQLHLPDLFFVPPVPFLQLLCQGHLLTAAAPLGHGSGEGVSAALPPSLAVSVEHRSTFAGHPSGGPTIIYMHTACSISFSPSALGFCGPRAMRATLVTATRSWRRKSTRMGASAGAK